MATVNILVNGSSAIPMREDPIIMWPVEETGKNSVTPSMIARMIDSNIDMMIFGIKANALIVVDNLFCGPVQDGKDLDHEACHDDHRAERESEKTKTVLLLIKRHNGKTGDQG